MTDSVEQIEMLLKVVSDVENWWRNCLHFTLNHVTEVEKFSGPECSNSRSVPKDTIAKLLFQGIKLVQEQRNLIKDMRPSIQEARPRYTNQFGSRGKPVGELVLFQL